MSSLVNATLDADDMAENKGQIDQHDYECRINLTQSSIRLMKIRTQLNLIRLNMCNNDQDFQMSGKNNKDQDPNQDKDSLSLLAEQEVEEVQTQDEGTESQSQPQSQSQSQGLTQEGGVWVCPKQGCDKKYKKEKTLKAHIENKHGGCAEEAKVVEPVAGPSGANKIDDSLDESSFAPSRSSTHESAVTLADDRADRKRNRSGNSDDGEGDDGKPRAKKLGLIDEEGLNLDLLDDTFEREGVRSSTQGILSEAAEVISRAERVVVELEEPMGGEDPDDSMNRANEKALTEMEEKLRLKDDMLHNKNSKLAEVEAELEEAREINDEKERLIRKASEDLKQMEKRVEEVNRKLAAAEAARKGEKIKPVKASINSPGKDQLKQQLEKQNRTIECLTRRAENVKKDLDLARRNLRKQETDSTTYQKLQVSLEQTLRRLDEAEQELEKLKKERSILMKKIPCKMEGCNRGRTCENSHSLRYDNRTEPRDNNWRKTVLCRYYLQGRCDKTDDECNFIHERPNNKKRDRSQEMEYEGDNSGSFTEVMNKKFRKVREERADSSVEIMEEYRGNNSRDMSWSRGNNRMNSSQRSGSERSMYERSGNERGAFERSRQSVPWNQNHNSQRSTNRNPTLRMTLRQEGNQEGAAARQWSPIRSPEDLDRSRPRDRDLRESMGRGRGRGYGSVRARLGYQNGPGRDLANQNQYNHNSNQDNQEGWARGRGRGNGSQGNGYNRY